MGAYSVCAPANTTHDRSIKHRPFSLGKHSWGWAPCTGTLCPHHLLALDDGLDLVIAVLDDAQAVRADLFVVVLPHTWVQGPPLFISPQSSPPQDSFMSAQLTISRRRCRLAENDEFRLYSCVVAGCGAPLPR